MWPISISRLEGLSLNSGQNKPGKFSMLSDGELQLVRHCTPTRMRRTSDKAQAAYRPDLNLVPISLTDDHLHADT